MDLQNLNEFVYVLHNKMEAVEAWALTVNEAITDHAERIDGIKASAHSAFNAVRIETDAIRADVTKAAATAESDTREVMRLVDANDASLKAIVAANDLALKEWIQSLITTVSTEIEKGKSEAATAVGGLAQSVDTRVREIQQQQGSQASAGPSDTHLRAVVESLNAKFLQHEQLSSHVLDAGATMSRFAAVESAIAALQQGVRANTGATTGEQDPWARAAQDLRSRFDAAAAGNSMPTSGHEGVGGWGKGQ